MHIRVTLEPAIILGLVGVEIVEDHMDCGVRVVSDYIVHEVEELDAPAAIFVRGSDLAGGHLKSSKQGRSAVALVIVTMAGQSPAVRQLKIALGTLQRLNEGFSRLREDD